MKGCGKPDRKVLENDNIQCKVKKRQPVHYCCIPYSLCKIYIATCFEELSQCCIT